MVTIEEIISKPHFEVKGNGVATLNDSIEFDGKFSVKLFSNGSITGDFEYEDPQAFGMALGNKFQSFALRGTTDDDLKVQVERCNVISTITNSDPPLLKFIFHPNKVMLNPDAETSTPQKELIIQFTLLNVRDTMGFPLNTNIGTFELLHFNSIEELQKIMELYKMSSITSIGEFNLKADGTKSLKKIVDESSKIMLDVLKMTSLAQTIWHNYVMIRVYEKLSIDKMTFMYGVITWTKNSVPIKWGIIGTGYFQSFIKSAWDGYSDKLNQTYGFDIALQWYVDSWTSGNVLESKFMSATTCLEMLMDKFHTQNNSEFLIDESNFEEVGEHTQKFLKEELTKIGVNEATIRAAFYRNLKGLNRRSYIDKATILLKHWKIRHDDIGTTMEEIINVRNKITHRGTYYKEGEEGLEELKRSFIGLEVLLTRLFLGMLNYEGLYFDWVAQEHVDFKTVRTP